MQQASLVFHIPSQRLEKRRDEVHSGLGLKVVLGRVVLLVSFKLVDELFEVRLKGGDGRGQESAPDIDLIYAKSLMLPGNGYKGSDPQRVRQENRLHAKW